jgi:hypothetical protein
MVMGVRGEITIAATDKAKHRQLTVRKSHDVTLRMGERAGQTRLRRRSTATVNELFRQVAYYRGRAADIEYKADSENREPSGFELDQIDHCLGIVRSILYQCMPFQFPKLATVEITPNEEAMAGALARIAEAMSLPARVQEEPEVAVGAPDVLRLESPSYANQPPESDDATSP